jgi:hypothetical protein
VQQHYRANKDVYVEKSTRRNARVGAENREKIRAYLREHPCIDCGETDLVVLQFDHVRGQKRKEVSLIHTWSWGTIAKEIAKCEVRCANCHIRRTALSRGWWNEPM